MLAQPAAAQRTSPFAVHVVQRGENLFQISLKYNLFAQQVAQANGITDSNSIIVGQRLIIPVVPDEAQRLVHIVAAGETLASIAAAYTRSDTQLLAQNKLESADAIFVGQELVIVPGPADSGAATPGADARAIAGGSSHSFTQFGESVEPFLHTVTAGETLFEIGLRYNQTVAAMVQANNLLDPSQLSIGQRLIIPGIQLPKLAQDLPPQVEAFTIDPSVLPTGRSARVALHLNTPGSVSASFLGRRQPVIESADSLQHRILLAVPMFTEVAIYPLELVLALRSGERSFIVANLQVIGGAYGYQNITINNSDLLTADVEAQEIKLLEDFTRNFRPERSWKNSLSLPAAAAMNARFGILRSYNGGEYDRYHRGVDFAGAPGTSVLAAAEGTVILSDRLQIRGNTTLIDHGWGLYTLYAHQNETYVQPGEVVLSGQVIGTIGSTGRSTGPHLHWEVWLNGVAVDPLQWVQQTFP